MGNNKPYFLILTGLSGAGHSVALKALEDVGFFCVDNLPIELLKDMVGFVHKGEYSGRSFAIGMDIRDRKFINQIKNLKSIFDDSYQFEIIFLTATPEVLADRYTTSRRRHPLLDQSGELMASILRERELLNEVEVHSDLIIDTTELSPHQLSKQLTDRYTSSGLTRSLHVTITSFGFKYGVPKSVDCVYDLRFLANPYFTKNLREKNGTDQEIKDFIFKHENTKTFCKHLFDMNRFLIPCYFDEGKFYLRIGLGCTGGQHRSVALAEWLAKELEAENKNPNIFFSINHRDLHLG